jgi:hypothetical protein
MPPGSPPGAGRVAAARKMFPEKLERGIIVTQVLVPASKVALAVVIADEIGCSSGSP